MPLNDNIDRLARVLCLLQGFIVNCVIKLCLRLLVRLEKHAKFQQMKTIIFLLLFPLLYCFNFVYGQANWHFVSQNSGYSSLVITDELHAFFYKDLPDEQGGGYKIYRSTDGGYNFYSIVSTGGDGMGCCTVLGIFALDSNTVFYIHSEYGISSIKRRTIGANTVHIGGFPSGYSAMCFLSEEFGYVSLSSEYPQFKFFRYSPNGWENLGHEEHFFRYSRMEFVNDSTGFITGQDGEFSLPHNQVILKTADYGNTLSEVFTTNEFEFKDIHFVADSVGIAIGTNGMILKTQDAGLTWNIVNSNTSLSLNSIDFSDEGVGCIVGEEGLILKSYDLGETWVQVPFIGTQDLIYVRIFNNEHIFINDATGSLYSSQDNSGVDELSNTNKTLVKILDMMGRETTFKPNTPLIYVYDDGSTEKVFSVDY